MQFDILGPLRVRRHDHVISVSAAKQRAILALLLLQANRVVTSDQLIAGVWGDAPPVSARRTLQSLVSRLRRALEPCRDCQGTTQLIVRHPCGYQLTVPRSRIDVHRFGDLVAHAHDAAAAGQSADAARQLRRALGLWRGEALIDVPRTAAIAAEAVTLEEQRLTAVYDRIDVDLQLGHHDQLLGELRALTAEQPLRERPWHRLMLALYRTGRQADALAAYRRVCQILRNELGAEPGAELRRLHRAILNQNPRLDAPSPLAAPATPTPRQLPAAVAGFTGRAQCLAALDDMLPDDDPAQRPSPVTIAVISGAAGVGKTAVAVHWAHRVASRFPDGQLYLDLRGAGARAALRPIDALGAFLSSLGTPAPQIADDEALAAALYRSKLAGRRVLVVLDNAATVEQVRPLLPGTAGCMVLVTSRDPLTDLVARDGARRLALDALAADEAQGLLARLLEPARIHAEVDLLDDLANTSGRLPLALRVAATSLIDDHSRTTRRSSFVSSSP